jgi:CubicO group peptidase (beta-lactamase class C family)
MFSEFQTLVQNATPDHVRAELPKLFTSANLERDTMARRIGALLEWRRRGGFELVRIENDTPTKVELEIRFPVTDDHWRLHVIQDPEKPLQIDELLMGRAPLPPLTVDREDEAIADEFIAYIDHLGEHELFSGAVLIGRHGKILGMGAAGLASREHDIPNTVTTLYNVASLVKPWTAVAIAKLVESGQLNYSDPLKRYVDTVDAPVEIRHLLSHTSGLGDYFGEEFTRLSKDRLRGIDDYLALADSFTPAFEPGSDWSYSNIGMLLLGKIIERISGKSYHEAIKKMVFEPAGMNTACFPHLDEVNRGCASGYGYKWTGNGPVAINALHSWAVRGSADGCAFATLNDIWQFSEALRHGGLVSKQTLDILTTAKPELGSNDYGYGFALLPERAIVGHSGGLIGASANWDMINDPDGWTVIVLANDLSMRTPVMKARQLIGVNVQERDDAKTQMPRAGLTAR